MLFRSVVDANVYTSRPETVVVTGSQGAGRTEGLWASAIASGASERAAAHTATSERKAPLGMAPTVAVGLVAPIGHDTHTMDQGAMALTRRRAERNHNPSPATRLGTLSGQSPPSLAASDTVPPAAVWAA